jgi:hypothetical protein
MSSSLQAYREFWPFYLRQHAKPATRACHYIGTILELSILAYAAISGRWLMLLVAPIIGYGLAWLGHSAIEGNRPATFSHPFWSCISDHRMLGLFVCGRLAAELRAVGVS